MEIQPWIWGLYEKRTQLYLLVKLQSSAWNSPIRHAGGVSCYRLCIWLYFRESKTWQGHQALMGWVYLTFLQALVQVLTNIIV